MAAAFAGFGLASPLIDLPKVFSAVQVKVDNFTSAPVLNLAKVYAKYNAEPPTQVKVAASSAAMKVATTPAASKQTVTGSIVAQDQPVRIETCSLQSDCVDIR